MPSSTSLALAVPLLATMAPPVFSASGMKSGTRDAETEYRRIEQLLSFNNPRRLVAFFDTGGSARFISLVRVDPAGVVGDEAGALSVDGIVG